MLIDVGNILMQTSSIYQLDSALKILEKCSGNQLLSAKANNIL
jgi:hypothetical protein